MSLYEQFCGQYDTSVISDNATGEAVVGSSSSLVDRVESEKATKFISPELQSKYEHLNLQLSKVPADAKGLMAELSGLQQLSAATKAALATPNAVVHKRKEHSRREHLRKEHEKRSKKKQGMIDVIKAKGSARVAKAAASSSHARDHGISAQFPGKRRSGGSALQAR